MVSPNREGLLSISKFAVNSQFAQTYSSAIFKYQGEVTEEYKSLCAQLKKVVCDAIDDLNIMNSQIPDFEEQ